MDKSTFAELIDAYADARASKNKVLIKVMISQLEQALNLVFPEASEEAPASQGVEITEEY
jgi:hypothetical protein